MQILKDLTRKLVGEKAVGAIDYYSRRQNRDPWKGPFNGQQARQALFLSLMERLSPRAVVETGAFLGVTTEFLAQFGRPVVTIEADPRKYAFVRARLRKYRNVSVLSGDSRTALHRLFEGRLRAFRGDTLFFYLDAHGNADLPLAEELDIVFDRCPAAVVMVDDFEVPHDPLYGFDDYGPDKTLNARYIAAVVDAHSLAAFYPATAAIHETGRRRGCVVLARRALHHDTLASLPLLRCGDG